jgi:hypothetical protein
MSAVKSGWGTRNLIRLDETANLKLLIQHWFCSDFAGRCKSVSGLAVRQKSQNAISCSCEIEQGHFSQSKPYAIEPAHVRLAQGRLRVGLWWWPHAMAGHNDWQAMRPHATLGQRVTNWGRRWASSSQRWNKQAVRWLAYCGQ